MSPSVFQLKEGRGRGQCRPGPPEEPRADSPAQEAEPGPARARLLNPPNPPLCPGGSSCGREAARPCLGMSPPLAPALAGASPG